MKTQFLGIVDVPKEAHLSFVLGGKLVPSVDVSRVHCCGLSYLQNSVDGTHRQLVFVDIRNDAGIIKYKLFPGHWQRGQDRWAVLTNANGFPLEFEQIINTLQVWNEKLNVFSIDNPNQSETLDKLVQQVMCGKTLQHTVDGMNLLQE
jgi:hypothetical protein